MAQDVLPALEAHRARLARLLGAEVADDGGVLAVTHPRLAWPWVNYACPLAPPAAGAAERAMARLVGAGRVPCLVLPLPEGSPPPLAPARVRGLLPGAVCRERQAVYLAAAPPDDGAVPANGGGPAQVWVVPPAAAGRWSELMLAAFGVPAELRPGLAAAWAGAPAAAGPGEAVRLYLAEVAGEAVGSGMLYVDAAGIAGLYGGAVAAEHRRRGVAGALVRRRLRDAFALGARLAVTQTAADGAMARLWERLGYRPAYAAEMWY